MTDESSPTPKPEPEPVDVKVAKINVVGMVLTAIVSVVLTTLLTPLFQSIFNRSPTPPPIGLTLVPTSISNILANTPTAQKDTRSVPIEFIPMEIFAFSGEVDNPSNAKGWGKLKIHIAENVAQSYMFEYVIPKQGDGYAGFVFYFLSARDFTGYESLQFQIDFGAGARTNLYFRDIRGINNSVVLGPLGNDVPLPASITAVIQGTRVSFKVPLATNLANLQQNVITEFGFYSDQGSSRDWHNFTVSDVKLVKR